MTLSRHPTLHPRNWRRAIEAHVPRKAARDWLNRLRFGPDAPQSDECIYVDPCRVHHQFLGKASRFDLGRQASGRVLAGDWDKARGDIEANMKLQSCRMRWQQGAKWEDTPIHARHRAEIAAGKAPDGMRSLDDLDARAAALDAIFEETRARGRLLAQHELPDMFRREAGGVLIHIGRDGTLLRAGGGAHRFAIARILELTEMPAQLGVVHALAMAENPLIALRKSRLT
ncbi:hypothetical protein [Cognatishimia sp. F0-27]|uniref:hypothetical protein n=1 Tax=Cognatishimia sp. F0-27 TaxID=2816855 RepID=UPI001D0C82C9|nr:hypothetical protein [Cognatishimia sp. F0-27]MCC1491526.1 hypothetical protein [Cognatishimia sp. F0-27]